MKRSFAFFLAFTSLLSAVPAYSDSQILDLDNDAHWCVWQYRRMLSIRHDDLERASNTTMDGLQHFDSSSASLKMKKASKAALNLLGMIEGHCQAKLEDGIAYERAHDVLKRSLMKRKVTVYDLAERVDGLYRFPDEVPHEE